MGAFLCQRLFLRLKVSKDWFDCHAPTALLMRNKDGTELCFHSKEAFFLWDISHWTDLVLHYDLIEEINIFCIFANYSFTIQKQNKAETSCSIIREIKLMSQRHYKNHRKFFPRCLEIRETQLEALILLLKCRLQLFVHFSYISFFKNWKLSLNDVSQLS